MPLMTSAHAPLKNLNLCELAVGIDRSRNCVKLTNLTLVGRRNLAFLCTNGRSGYCTEPHTAVNAAQLAGRVCTGVGGRRRVATPSHPIPSPRGRGEPWHDHAHL